MKHLLNIKVKAGALQYTIFISVVIALLVFGFIGLTYVQHKLRLKNNAFNEVVHQNHLAFQSFENNDKSLLTDEKGIETSISIKQWGVFKVVTSTSVKGKEKITKSAFLGGNISDRPALFLQDENQPLVVVGTTKIEGTVLLPKQGVKQGSIAGHSYGNRPPIYGSILNSNELLPKAKNLEHLQQFKDSITITNSFKQLDLNNKTQIINSFTEETQLLYDVESIDLQNISLVGNIIVRSNTKITVYETAKLSDIIIIAPKIEVKENVKGNFQAFAEKELIINENVKLDYPTSLLLSEKKPIINLQYQPVEQTNQLIINKNSVVKGVVGFLTKSQDNTYKAQLILEKDAVVTGEVYCQQNIELKGTVNGSVYTKGFVANEFGSVYKNHIYNGQILIAELPKQYVGLNFKNTKQKIAKWINY